MTASDPMRRNAKSALASRGPSTHGATAVLSGKNARTDPWRATLLDGKPKKLAAVALANKMARIAFAVMTRQEDFRPRVAA